MTEQTATAAQALAERDALRAQLSECQKERDEARDLCERTCRALEEPAYNINGIPSRADSLLRSWREDRAQLSRLTAERDALRDKVTELKADNIRLHRLLAQFSSNA